MTYNPTLVNVGAAPNDGQGDPARTAFQKINDNFTQAATNINNVTSVTNLPDGGPYATSGGDPQTDWVVVSRNLSSTVRLNVSEITNTSLTRMYSFGRPGTNTFTLPDPALTPYNYIRIICIGGGGGGGGAATCNSGGSASGGAGGGGGAYSDKTFLVGQFNITVTPTLTVFVGAGGTKQVGRAAGSAGAPTGAAATAGEASYVSGTDATSGITNYFVYANGGLGGGPGSATGAASTGGDGASWLPLIPSTTVPVAGTYAAGSGDALATLNNIVNPWCGGPGVGTSSANGTLALGAIVMFGGAGGGGGGSILAGSPATVKAPANITTAQYLVSSFFIKYNNTTFSYGGAASLTTDGGNAGMITAVGPTRNAAFGFGGCGGGAAYSTYKGGDGTNGGAGYVLIIIG